jgi:hypothetical protein
MPVMGPSSTQRPQTRKGEKCRRLQQSAESFRAISKIWRASVLTWLLCSHSEIQKEVNRHFWPPAAASDVETNSKTLLLSESIVKGLRMLTPRRKATVRRLIISLVVSSYRKYQNVSTMFGDCSNRCDVESDRPKWHQQSFDCCCLS